MGRLRAFHFRYIGYSKGETYKFYLKFIRGFLRWHRTQAVWVKGANVKRDAVIIITENLVMNVVNMLRAKLSEGGSFFVTEVNPLYVIYEAKELERQTVGYLHVGHIILGDSDEIHCPKESYDKVSVQENCRGNKFGAVCDAWDGYRCMYPEIVRLAKT